MFKYKFIGLILFVFFGNNLLAQASLDASLSSKKMQKDLKIFRNIRDAANSGVYKYRTVAEIDSIYEWATQKIERSNTYLDFYNIISTITDFEGSCHNSTSFSDKIYKRMRAETSGYFPYAIKMLGQNVHINSINDSILVGSKILTINGESIEQILSNIYKYVYTDGFNISGKSVKIDFHFSRYYRWYYGQQTSFTVQFIPPSTNETSTITLSNISYQESYKRLRNRHSLVFDKSLSEKRNEKPYQFERLDKTIAKLSIRSFGIGGNAKSEKHKSYVAFLDSILTILEAENIPNLIIDIRNNGGGTSPNEMVTFSAFSTTAHEETRAAWLSMDKIPYWRYFHLGLPAIVRPIARIKVNKLLASQPLVEKDNKFYYNGIETYEPHPKAYKGQVYLLTNPYIASASTVFASMMSGHTDAILVGEETMGGYYGHNGAYPIRYQLPNSKLRTTFSIANIEQNVPKKDNQTYGSGVIPDHHITQSVMDFLSNIDTQLNYTLKLIEQAK